MKPIHSYYYVGLSLLLIELLAWVSYYPALANGFILNWDDGKYIVNNTVVQQLSWENVYTIFTTIQMAAWHPLTLLSHALDYAIYGDTAWGHHLTSVLLHMVNSIWVFLLALVVCYVAEKPVAEHFSGAALATNAKRLGIASLTAIFFAIHPQHVESVAWVAERKDLLFFFFWVPALLSYIMYDQTQRKAWLEVSILLFTLSLMSKPMAISLPLILLLFDLYPLKQISLAHLNYRRWFQNKIPFLTIALLFGLATLFAQTSADAVASTQQIATQLRILNAINSIVIYLEKWLLPLHLSPFYQLQIYRFQSIQSYPFILVEIVVLGVITIWGVYCWRKTNPAWLTGWLFYLITLLPILGLIQVGSQGMADRYTYLPLLPWYGILSIGLVSLYANYSKFLSILLIVFISSLWIHLTAEQIKIWRDELTFWNYIVLSDPDSPLSQSFLGSAYLKQGNYELAVQHLQLSIMLSPNYSAPYYQLGVAYLRLEKLEEALSALQQALQLSNSSSNSIIADAHMQIAIIHYLRQDLTQAQLSLAAALRVVPNYEPAWALKNKLFPPQSDTLLIEPVPLKN